MTPLWMLECPLNPHLVLKHRAPLSKGRRDATETFLAEAGELLGRAGDSRPELSAVADRLARPLQRAAARSPHRID